MAANVQYTVKQEWHGGRVTTAVGIGGMRGVNKGAEYLKSRSVPLAPLDLGNLREAATIIPATPYLAEAALVFDTVYAAIQHERLDYQHDDGQAKYVEEPMVQDQRIIQGIIAQEVKVAILNA